MCVAMATRLATTCLISAMTHLQCHIMDTMATMRRIPTTAPHHITITVAMDMVATVMAATVMAATIAITTSHRHTATTAMAGATTE